MSNQIILNLILDQNTREWSFGFNDYEKLIKLLTDLKSCSVIIKEIPSYSMKHIQSRTEPVAVESCLEFIEPELIKTLLPFQKEGVRFGIARGGRFLLADDMGLGKTRQALAVADFYKSDWPLLIVTAANVRRVWYREITDLLPKVNVHDIRIVESKADIFFDAQVVITSYSLLSDLDNLERKQFNMVIFDESHSLKNPVTKQTKKAKILGRKAARVILLTGTPALNRPIELYSQLAIIDRNIVPPLAFSKRYCNGHGGKYGWDDSGSSNLRELNVILQKCYMIRRTKEDVYMELGMKKRIKVELQGIELLQQYSEQYQKAEGENRKNEILLKWRVETAKLKQEAVW